MKYPPPPQKKKKKKIYIYIYIYMKQNMPIIKNDWFVYHFSHCGIMSTVDFLLYLNKQYLGRKRSRSHAVFHNSLQVKVFLVCVLCTNWASFIYFIQNINKQDTLYAATITNWIERAAAGQFILWILKYAGWCFIPPNRRASKIDDTRINVI